MRIALFVDGLVGKKILQIFQKNQAVVDILILNHKSPTIEKEELKNQIRYNTCFEYEAFLQHAESLNEAEKTFDLGILCWWPYLIKDTLIKKANQGFLNLHPSFLPSGRGKHPNFWTFVDNTPFGVSIHWVDNSIDGGDIAFQSEIEKTWTDNGQTLYEKGLIEIVNLFERNFSKILTGNIPRIPQLEKTRVRYSHEINSASNIQLDQLYQAEHLLNLLRARTFEGYPGCWFESNGKKYEMSISLKEIE